LKIIVLVKQVPGTDSVKLDPITGVMVRTGKDTIINPLDENALAEAIRIKSTHPDVTITVVSMGPPSAMKAIKEAIAMGADGGVLVSGREFAGSDTIATAKVIAAGIKKSGTFDLILCGERATDGETGQTAAMIAHYLNVPAQTYVSALEILEDGVIVRRTVESGFERVQVPFPVLVSVNKDISDTGFPTLSGKLRAKNVEVPMWANAELGFDKSELGLTGSPTRVVKIFSPKLSRDTIMFKTNGTTKPIDELLSFLVSKDVV